MYELSCTILYFDLKRFYSPKTTINIFNTFCYFNVRICSFLSHHIYNSPVTIVSLFNFLLQAVCGMASASTFTVPWSALRPPGYRAGRGAPPRGNHGEPALIRAPTLPSPGDIE